MVLSLFGHCNKAKNGEKVNDAWDYDCGLDHRRRLGVNRKCWSVEPSDHVDVTNSDEQNLNIPGFFFPRCRCD